MGAAAAEQAARLPPRDRAAREMARVRLSFMLHFLRFDFGVRCISGAVWPGADALMGCGSILPKSGARRHQGEVKLRKDAVNREKNR